MSRAEAVKRGRAAGLLDCLGRRQADLARLEDMILTEAGWRLTDGAEGHGYPLWKAEGKAWRDRRDALESARLELQQRAQGTS